MESSGQTTMSQTSLAEIQDKIKEDDYRFSDHAIKRMIERSIERSEVEEAILIGEVIEEYPEDKFSPSCLIYGKTKAEKDLHVQISLPPKVIVITVSVVHERG